jgi:hypothetical protein
VNPAGSSASTVRILPAPGQSDWYVVNVPFVANFRQHSSAPVNVSFVINDASDYRFEVHQTCSDGPACASGLLGYGFADNACPGVNDCGSRGTAWPSTLLIRVYHSGGSLTCSRYQLQVTR